jgi:hypothetical protein
MGTVMVPFSTHVQMTIEISAQGVKCISTKDVTVRGLCALGDESMLF